MTDPARDGAYADWLDVLEDGEGTYLACPAGHGSLPPRRVCPTCGSRNLEREPLPEAGELRSFSEVHVATPQFEADAPYVIALAAFGPVTLTGLLRGVDSSEVSLGDVVGVHVEERVTTGDRAVVFRPR